MTFPFKPAADIPINSERRFMAHKLDRGAPPSPGTTPGFRREESTLPGFQV